METIQPNKEIVTMLSEMLKVFGFKQMSEDVLEEVSPERLSKYARVIMNDASRRGGDFKKLCAMKSNFKRLGLL